MTIILSEAPVPEGDEDKPGMILDYDADGPVVSLLDIGSLFATEHTEFTAT